jgi:D-3-phosphoglycerate dehydrogenase
MARWNAIYYTILEYQLENLKLLRANFNVAECAHPGDEDPAILAAADLCFAPLGYRFDGSTMDAVPRLRVIASNTTSVPHIDVAEAARRGIQVIALNDEQAFLETITATAEHTWGLLLALMRRTPWAHAAVLEGRWNRRPFGCPSMLSRMRLGIVGLGRLGHMVARFGQVFGMKVRYFDPENPAAGEVVARADSLLDLVGWADVVSLHAPATPETRHLIDRRVLESFRRGSWLINTARGELVDEEALVDLLESGHIAGAAVDVLDGEYEPTFDAASHPLVRYARRHDNLMLTPHIGGSTLDAWHETERRVIERAITFFEGGGA